MSRFKVKLEGDEIFQRKFPKMLPDFTPVTEFRIDHPFVKKSCVRKEQNKIKDRITKKIKKNKEKVTRQGHFRIYELKRYNPRNYCIKVIISREIKIKKYIYSQYKKLDACQFNHDTDSYN